MKKTAHEDGFSILEALFATFIMTIGIVGLMSLFTIAAVRNAGQGEQSTRCTEYAQDKMEQLLALSFSDSTSQTSGNTTLCSTCTGYVSGVGLTAGGTPMSVTSPIANYTDYVVWNGNAEVVQTASTPGTLLYTREWSITNGPTGCSLTAPVTCVKTVTVTVTANFTGFAVGVNNSASAIAPTTTLIAQKESY
jgi:Tfp pilus assembly protein PilV